MPDGERKGRLWRWLPFVAACAAALAVRLIDLGVRPFHHDEGVNAWFLADLLDGFQWSYDPARFHGPFLYFFGLPFALLFGESDIALRLPVALVSAGLLPLLLLLRNRLGIAGVTAAAWLLALSPSLVSYGRDLIHETYLIALTLALVVAVSRYLETARDSLLIAAAGALGLLATVKETYVLTLTTLAIAALLARRWMAGGLRLRELGPPPQPGTAWRAVVAFAVPYVLFYTSFLTNPRGLVDSVRTFLLWAEKGVEGAEHTKAWDYFPRLLGSFEAAAVTCAVLGGWLAVRRRDPFGTFCALWAAGQLAVYSLIPYKTPWLILNVVLPLALTGGVLFREAWAAPKAVWRFGVTAAFALGLAWSGWRAVEVSFLRYDDDRLGLVYAQTHRDIRKLEATVRAALRRVPADRKPALKIFARHGWPLPWSFRDVPGMVYRLEAEESPDADVVVTGSKLDAEVKPRLRGCYRRSTFLLRVREPFAVYVSCALAHSSRVSAQSTADAPHRFGGAALPSDGASQGSRGSAEASSAIPHRWGVPAHPSGASPHPWGEAAEGWDTLAEAWGTAAEAWGAIAQAWGTARTFRRSASLGARD